MHYLIVHQTGQPDRLFSCPAGDVILGRGGEASLVLPNISISRHHAQLTPDGAGGMLAVDLDSGNGTRVNGARLGAGELRPLESGDRIQMGTFKLTYLRGDIKSLSYEGRHLRYMAVYGVDEEAARDAPQDATFSVNRVALLKQAEIDHRAESARLVCLDSDASWEPEKDELILGRKGAVPVRGFFAAGQAASVIWRDRDHVITPLSGWTRTFVNDERVQGPCRLADGDRVRVGRSEFQYQVPPSERLQRAKARREQVNIPPGKKKPPAPEEIQPVELEVLGEDALTPLGDEEDDPTVRLRR